MSKSMLDVGIRENAYSCIFSDQTARAEKFLKSIAYPPVRREMAYPPKVSSCDFYGPVKDGWKGPAELLPKDTISDAQKELLWAASEKACGVTFAP